jgi:uncharacterized damage-inducible protein DinB
LQQNRAELLLAQMDHTYQEGGWFVPLEVALKGLTAAEATWRPAQGAHSIWEIVSHMTYWKEIYVARINGEPPPAKRVSNEETFETGSVDEADWEQTISRFHASSRALRAIAERGEEALDQELREESVALAVASLVMHDANHVGQIIYIRKLQGSWPRPA